ncbi:MAG: hypothetical protein PHE59_03510 [Patescibacteria group bacterium]|nr:hypothetical protein [Patescibacteria group bacterium]MDD5164879.1 hypothetical protein [Patescibacteria group bacterium]MDD5534663.1 hypothetical protein [Patescibacteria group bacterium]
MKKFNAITTVYSYYFPEIRKIITDLTKNYPHQIFLKSIDPGLDDFHFPIIDQFLKFQSEAIPRLKDFAFKYPIGGAEEGIREILTMLQSKGIKQIYVLKGDYEGYQAVAETRNIKTIEVDKNTDPTKIRKGYWFISNPSACDGNILSDEFINNICQAGHKIIYDLTYLGMTDLHHFDISHPNIIAVLVSFSKPYGLFYYRLGFAFSRISIPSLYGNKWFKNILSLLIIRRIMVKFNCRYFSKKYKPVQKKIVNEINKQFELNLKPSDALLLAYLNKKDAKKLNSQQLKLIKKFKRGDNYRFCLTPYYQEYEKNMRFH